MAHEEFESIINVLKCIGVRGRRVEGGPDVGCYDVATTPIVTAAELQCVSSLHDDSSDRIWTSLEEYGTTFSELANGFLQCLLSGGQYAVCAACAYSRILSLPGCQVLSMFDCATSMAFLKVIQDLCIIKRPDSPLTDSSEEDRIPEKTSATTCCFSSSMDGNAIFSGIGTVLRMLCFSDREDTFKAIAQTLALVLGSAAFPDDVACSAGAMLQLMLDPRHGPPSDTAAVILRHLIPPLLKHESGNVMKGSKALASRNGVWARVLDFILGILRDCPGVKDAVKALLRHVLLKASDKADARHVAICTAVRLAVEMQSCDQHDLVVFTLRLSRTSKVLHRSLSVDLATELLNALPEPFAPTSVIRPVPRAETSSKVDSAAATPEPSLREQKSVHQPGASHSKKSSVDGGELPPSSSLLVPWGTICLAVLHQRASDKAAAVRSKAIGNLASVVSAWGNADHSSEASAQFREALMLAHKVKAPEGPSTTPTIIMPPFISPPGSDEPGGSPMLDTTSSPMPLTGNTVSLAPFVQRALAGSIHRDALRNAAARARTQIDIQHVTRLAHRRIQDSKASVRKAAVQLLEALVVLRGRDLARSDPEPISPADITVFEHATTDAMVSVRKTALIAVGNLLKEFPQWPAVARLWVGAALPLVKDHESAIQDNLLDQLHDFLMAPTGKVGHALGRSTNSAQTKLDSLCPILTALGSLSAAEQMCLGRACSMLSARRRLQGKNVIAGLEEVIKNIDLQHSAAEMMLRGCWILLVELSTCEPTAPSWTFLQVAWQHMKDKRGFAKFDNTSLLLRVVANAASGFPVDQSLNLANELFQAIQTFNLPPSAASAYLQALAQLTADVAKKSLDNGSLYQRSILNWGSTVLRCAEKNLTAFMGACGNDDGRPSEDVDFQEHGVANTLFVIGEVALLLCTKASQRLTTVVQALTSADLTLHALDGRRNKVPHLVQGHAWIALGKLCLMDESLAKKSLPLFIKELGEATSPVVRNNIMVALADLCMQWTALVDPYIPRLASCMDDANELVRRQGLALLTNLLLKDYVRWRGSLFHRFLVALVDESSDIKGLADFLLNDALMIKAPLLAYNYFVECLFALNDCKPAHCVPPGVGDLAQSLQEHQWNHVPCISGDSPSARAKRETIYKVLLRRLAPEHKFATAAKLCGEVLAGFAEGTYTLTGASEVLRDTLCILSWQEIKTHKVCISLQVNASRSASADDDESSGQAAAAGAAKGRLVSAMMKKHLVEGMLPVLVELKKLLEYHKHPFLGLLFLTLRALLQEHATKLEDILVGDRQLAKEILHDIRQAEHEENLRKTQCQRSSGLSGSGQPLPAESSRTGSRHQPRCPGPSRLGNAATAGVSHHGTLSQTPRALEVLAPLEAQRNSRLRQTPASLASPCRKSLPAITPYLAEEASHGHPSMPICCPSSGGRTPAANHLLTPGPAALSGQGQATPITVPRLRTYGQSTDPRLRRTASMNGWQGEETSDGDSPDTIVLPNPSLHIKSKKASTAEAEPQSPLFEGTDDRCLAKLQSESTSSTANVRKRKLDLSD